MFDLMLKYILLPLSFVFLSACTTMASSLPGCPDQMVSGDYCAFDSRRDAKADLQVAQELAAADGLKTLVVMGANWCHDSRALAGHFEKERFRTLIAEHYRLVYIDVGKKNRNLDIARSFGLDGIAGTPTIIMTDKDGTVLNLDTAPTWRNAASRSEDDIYNYFADYAAEGN